MNSTNNKGESNIIFQTETYLMKNNWKEDFEQQFGDMPLWRPKGEKLEVYGRLVNFIESLLAEQKKELMEKLDDMAFENDNGYKVELFINWDEAKKKLWQK